MEMLSHYTAHLKLMLHCLLTTWNLNKNFSKEVNLQLSCDSAIPLLGIIHPKEMKTNSNIVVQPRFVAASFSIAKGRSKPCVHCQKNGQSVTDTYNAIVFSL